MVGWIHQQGVWSDEMVMHIYAISCQPWKNRNGIQTNRQSAILDELTIDGRVVQSSAAYRGFERAHVNQPLISGEGPAHRCV